MTTLSHPKTRDTNDLTLVVTNLLTAKPKTPQKTIETAEMFTRALESHLQDLFVRDFESAFSTLFGRRLDPRLLKEISERFDNSPFESTKKHAWTSTNEPGGGIEKAIEDGARFKQEALKGQEMLSSKEGADRARITRQALNNRRKNNQALGLSLASRDYKYPAWQFDDAVAAILPDILNSLGDRDTWGKYLFFVSAEPLLKGESPLQAIKSGKGKEALRVARLLSEEAEATEVRKQPLKRSQL